MLQGHFYHKTLRKIVAAFGTMFNSIILVKYDANMVEQERLKVPLTYAQKEKFIYALITENVPKKITQIELPRMSFEMTGLAYDAQRKLPSLNRNFNRNTSNNSLLVQNYTPVPYDFSFELNIYTRNIEDMSQIIEQIVPYFTPDYTVTISLVNENGVAINRDIPITLQGIIPQVEFDSDGITPRVVIYTMSFTMKAYLFGPLTNSAIIRKAFASIYDTLAEDTEETIVMQAGGIGNYRFEEEVYAGNNWINADWTGRVINWDLSRRTLYIYQVQGKNLPTNGDIVTGFESGARWNIATASRSFLKHAQIVAEPFPTTANVGDANVIFTANTTEFPNTAPGP